MRSMRARNAAVRHRRRGCTPPAMTAPFCRPPNVRAQGGMYVPSDSFGGQSPERKAAGILRTFFTFVAARVVLAQLEGSGRGALGAYDSQAAADLHHFLQSVPMKDGDEWLAQLMRQNTSLGLRLMEVRDSYCEEAFEWDQLQRLAKKDMKGANTKLMRTFAAASLAASLSGDEAAAGAASLAGWRAAAESGAAVDTNAGVTTASTSTSVPEPAAAEAPAAAREGGDDAPTEQAGNSELATGDAGADTGDGTVGGTGPATARFQPPQEPKSQGADGVDG